jgi:hypothetical protein
MFGRAAYNFAYLEQEIVWVGETLLRGFISRSYQLTSLQIARELVPIVSALEEGHPLKPRLQMLAQRFVELAVTRNELLHSRPYTAVGGEQRLAYRGRSGQSDWPIEHIVETARAFEEAAIEAGDLLHAGGLYEAYSHAAGHA